MKLSKLVFVLVVFLFSCVEAPPPSQIYETKEHLGVADGKDIYVYTIDSCEYIGSLRWAPSDVITHKGNCRYCAQRNSKNK